MLIYGDPQFRQSLHGFRSRLSSALLLTNPDRLDELRTVLIQCGQLEQAVQDRWLNPDPEQRRLILRITRCTDMAAEAFYARWFRTSGAKLSSWATGEPLKLAATELQSLSQVADTNLTIKTPEGFEFYALFPEQYCASTLQWAQSHNDGPKRALVIGIRSIGTTLSALVTRVLQACGWDAMRLTVRPQGDPFSRSVQLPPEKVYDFPFGLVVDEGPGLSGSSMAATARALIKAGIERVTFLPGHAGDPGAATPAQVRAIWETTPRCCTPLTDLRWDGYTLFESLACRSAALLTAHGGKRKIASGTLAIESLGGGLWRRPVYSSEAEWPAVCARLERSKFRYGVCGEPSLFWKFIGFGCASENRSNSAECAMQQMLALAERGLSPPPIDSSHGFVAMPWIEGQRLRAADSTDASVLKHLAHYIVQRAQAPLTQNESAEALNRLTELLHCNTQAALGSFAADQTRRLAANLSAATAPPFPTYGDGRMAPHEWVRTASGTILKTDCVGHDADHTLIGRQSLLWDVAGVLTEWDLNGSTAELLFSALDQAGIRIDPNAQRFYNMAYAAFRMGLMAFEEPQNQAETLRAQRAFTRYRQQLANLIGPLKS